LMVRALTFVSTVSAVLVFPTNRAVKMIILMLRTPSRKTPREKIQLQ